MVEIASGTPSRHLKDTSRTLRKALGDLKHRTTASRTVRSASGTPSRGGVQVLANRNLPTSGTVLIASGMPSEYLKDASGTPRKALGDLKQRTTCVWDGAVCVWDVN
ncbi:hypothetical protein L1987_83553 [Smallanthus sonchifolius]|uniref:Uncharacterized protein n=1 Tax=Smallanthus sonchifolius TaxID=185202 RepID=A0ACB8YCC6_9ASTR|nr:hypothetical protein L1987_83553 [Smallanthus sonchifolius]